VTPATLEALTAARAAKEPVVLATWLGTGESRLIVERDLVPGEMLADACRASLRDDKPQILDTDEGEVFLNPFNPPLRMAILGAVHIAQPLAAMATLASYAVTVIDPRTAFASTARFPGVTLVHDWPDEAMISFKADRRSAVVALTHDPKLDDPALDVVLKSDCFYIAALGSRKTHANRLERLKARGHNDVTLARIRGPAGLDIGAKSPAEIAISILAEATAILRRGAAAT
jgi:xanthine dehydrogenase accessory factor